MSDAVVIAMVVAIPPTLVALAGLIQSVLNGKKADDIHVLVNSNMQELKIALKDALAEINALKAVAAVRDHS